jgi:ribosomal 50S subunit-recycling heat shock protein
LEPPVSCGRINSPRVFTREIKPASASEPGANTATFIVSRTGSTASSLIANISYNGTATASSDYVSKTQTLTFAAGTTQQTFSVTINGDRTVEPNETFTVVLSNPSGAIIGTGTGTVTILNDD